MNHFAIVGFGILLAAVVIEAIDTSAYLRDFHQTVARGPNERCGDVTILQVAEYYQLTSLHIFNLISLASDEDIRQNFQHNADLIKQVVCSVLQKRLSPPQGVHEIERLSAANFERIISNSEDIRNLFKVMQKSVEVQWNRLGAAGVRRMERARAVMASICRHFDQEVYKQTEERLRASVAQFAAQTRECGSAQTWQRAVRELLLAERVELQRFTQEAQRLHEEFDRQIAKALGLKLHEN